MTWIYLLSTIFGSIFVVPMLLGGLDIDGDVDIDLDMDVDADFDLDLDTDIDGGFDGALDVEAEIDGGGDGFFDAFGDFAGSLLSFRSIVLLITFFGISGLVFTGLGFGAIPTALSATALGFVAASLNSLLFTALRRSEANSQLTDNDIRGTVARVVLPIHSGRKGRIVVELNQQPLNVVALPSALDQDEVFGVGDSVVVVDLEDGTALVTRLDLDSPTPSKRTQAPPKLSEPTVLKPEMKEGKLS